MKLGVGIAFAVSLAANAAALWLLVPQPSQVADTLPMAMTASVSPSVTVERVGDGHAYLEALLARGLSLAETKPLVLARLSADAASENDSRAASEYWRSSYSVAVMEILGRRVAAADRVRASLLALYGPSARNDAVFASVFAPLDARYGFLASEHQVALQKLQVQRLLAQAKSAPSRSASPASATEAASSATAEVLQSLRAHLGPPAALEYMYRFSPLAEQLRAAELDLSGAEFRSAFDALLQFESSAADPHAFVRTRETLRNTLGDARFTRLWATRDPFFGALAAAGRERGLAEGTLVAAYSIFNDAQDRLAAAAERYAVIDPPRAGEESHRIQEDLQQQLGALVGEDVAAALFRAVTRLSVSMQSPPSTHLKE